MVGVVRIEDRGLRTAHVLIPCHYYLEFLCVCNVSSTPCTIEGRISSNYAAVKGAGYMRYTIHDL